MRIVVAQMWQPFSAAAVSTMAILVLSAAFGNHHHVEGFTSSTTISTIRPEVGATRRATTVAVILQSSNNNNNNRWDRDLEERSRNKAVSGGIGAETAAGAVLGGILGGPFGAIFGASLGSSLGARNAVDRAKRDEMERLGLTPEMMDTANDVALALERSNEGLQAVQESLETQQRFARRLDADVTGLYNRAQKAIMASDDELARKLLMQRTELQEKLKTALVSCAEERRRLQKMEDNVAQLKRRALEVESLMSRSVSSSVLRDKNTSADFSLPVEDPLLKKFNDMGID